MLIAFRLYNLFMEGLREYPTFAVHQERELSTCLFHLDVPITIDQILVTEAGLGRRCKELVADWQRQIA